MRNIPLKINSGFSLLCVGLFVALLAVPGCSKPEKKAPEKEKKVVTEMNIQSSNDTEKATPSKENEVESLPFESDEASEEELPILGSGG
jgi:hypothetical protein